ncbi:hypothetical protein BJ875DRAFT_470829 [Amylocarpus encephaloides]|uniref:Zinc knuckle protein n=1 Tax=Amylocarpus encephaloides TaxID=45428 RepID=A0A9P8C2F0_9HELO|nr:hypothetical protein BJ875DRAFT_470829 [Amylocarpus encephaloides]
MASSSPPSSAPKAMSSRLLTMKFMQRAAASSTASPSTTHEEPPSKRRRRDVDPSSFNVHALVDQKTIQRAVAEEEAKQQAALDRQAAESGDTRWVLSFEDDKRSLDSPSLALRVVQTGYAGLDSLSPLQVRPMEDEEPQDKALLVGRRSFGKFNRALEKQQDPTMESDDDDDKNANEPSEDSEAVSDDPTSELIKASRKEAVQRAQAESKARKKEKKTKADELAKQRKKKEVNLNGLTSLSGSKPSASAKPLGPCYQCNGPHLRANCPENKRGHPGGDDGPPRKTFRSR